jgi:hypothetical protein
VLAVRAPVHVEALEPTAKSSPEAPWVRTSTLVSVPVVVMGTVTVCEAEAVPTGSGLKVDCACAPKTKSNIAESRARPLRPACPANSRPSLVLFRGVI